MLKRYPAIILALLLLLSASNAAGAPPQYASAPLTLQDCIKAALDNNRALLAQAERLNAADAGVGQARSYFLPKIDVSETYMRSDNPVMAFGSKLNQGRFAAIDFDVSKLNDPDAIDNFNFRAQVVQPVFNGGRELVGLKMARLGLAASEKDLERARQETAFQAVKAYYGVALAGEYVKVAEKALETTQLHLDTAQRFFEQGMLIGSEVLLARVRLAEVEEMRLKAVNGLETARAGLNMVMGRDQGTPVELADLMAPGEPPDDMSSYMEEAVRLRPDLEGMRINVRNMEAGVDMARTGYLPNLNFIARYELDDKDIFKGRGGSYTILGMLSWNIFDGFLTTKKVAEARANLNATGYMRDHMKEGVLFEVRRSYNNVVEACRRVDVAGAAVDEGEEALRIIQRRFEAGMTKTLDVLDAETALTRARANMAQALYDYNVSMAELKLATGRMACQGAAE